MIDNIELIGLLAAILTTTAFIPQVYKVIKTKSVKGLSLTTYLIFATGVLFWLIYGLLKSSISMIIGNGITFLLAFSILYYILKNRNLFKYQNKKILIESFPVKHGHIDSLCYLINKKLACASDISLFYKKDYRRLMKLDFLIIDCLWYKKHSAHFNLSQVLELVNFLKPKKTILTNMHSDLDYDQLKKKLPKNVIPGFDGMSVNLKD